MPPLSLLQFLIALCLVSVRADDPFINDRNGVVATTTTSPSASSTTSSSASTTTASMTSTTATSTSASATPTSSPASNAFHWNGSEITAVVILLVFIFFGVGFIGTWQARRMIARRRDNAGLRAYAEHQSSPSVDTDVSDTNGMMAMDGKSQFPRHNPRSNSNYTNKDLERQLTGASVAASQLSTTSVPAPLVVVHPANAFPTSRSPSPPSQAVLRPSPERILRRPYSFEEIPRPATPDLLAERMDRSALPSNQESTLLNSSPRPM